jgi:hypothetical protein
MLSFMSVVTKHTVTCEQYTLHTLFQVEEGGGGGAEDVLVYDY